MSLYGSYNLEDARAEELGNSNELLEAFILCELADSSEEEVEKFCESMLAQVLIEKNVLTKQKLENIKAAGNKADFNRRVKIAAYYMAKAAGDPNYAKLMKAQAMKKVAVEKIMTRFGKAAYKAAVIGQRKFIKNMGKSSSSSTTEDSKK